MIPSDVGQRANDRQPTHRCGAIVSPPAVGLVLMPMPSQQHILDSHSRLRRHQRSAAAHAVAQQRRHLVQTARFHVQHDGARTEQRAQLEQRMQRQRGHVRFRPAITALFDVLLELHPTGGLFPFEFAIGRGGSAANHAGQRIAASAAAAARVAAVMRGAHQFLHFGEERMRDTARIVGVEIFAEDELNSLCGRSDCKWEQKSGIWFRLNRFYLSDDVMKRIENTNWQSLTGTFLIATVLIRSIATTAADAAATATTTNAVPNLTMRMTSTTVGWNVYANIDRLRRSPA